MICPKCGKEISEQAAFCPFCHVDVSSAVAGVGKSAPEDDYAAINREVQASIPPSPIQREPVYERPENRNRENAEKEKMPGTAPLVLGIIGMVFCWCPVGLILGIIGLVLGIKILANAEGGKGKAIAATVLSGLAIFISLIASIALLGGSKSPDKKSDVVKTPTVESSKDTDESEGPSEPDTTPEPESEQVVSVSDQSEFYVGDTLDADGLKIVYVASGDFQSDNDFLQPADGKKYIFIELACENTADSDRSISLFSFNCYADGYAADGYYGEDDTLSATLSTGRTSSGRLYYEVPESAQQIEIEYEYNFWTDKKVKFIFEGDKNSGYEIAANTSASENAYKVGDIIEGDTLRLKYVSCEPYKSDNMFIEPKDGCEFITLSFEAENVSDSDKTISSFEFKCYADGKACDASYARDDDISATLSPGRKAQGTVTFEVPTDAAVVEVEYETNFWTSKHLVFTVR